MKQDHHKVSHTAVFCAKSLAHDTTLPYAKDIFEKLLQYDAEFVKEGNTSVMEIFRRLMYFIPKFSGVRTQLEGRFLAVNEALRQNKNPYVIELAAGFSPRGLDFTHKDPKRVYIETDLPELLTIKKEIVEKIRDKESKKSNNYFFAPVNVVNRKEVLAAAAIYDRSDKKKPLAFVHSGLYMYLNKAEQKKVRDTIAAALRKYSPNGMWITTDLSFDAGRYLSNPFIKWAMKRLEKKTGRPFTFFTSKEEATAFMNAGELSVEVIPGSVVAATLSSAKKYGLSIDRVRKGSFMYNVWVMKLAQPE